MKKIQWKNHKFLVRKENDIRLSAALNKDYCMTAAF